MGRSENVNVKASERSNVYNVNVRKATERRLVDNIVRKLGPESEKDRAYWHKVAQHLSEAEIQDGLEIAAERKPFGLPRIKYVGGIYRNMLRSHGV